MFTHKTKSCISLHGVGGGGGGGGAFFLFLFFFFLRNDFWKSRWKKCSGDVLTGSEAIQTTIGKSCMSWWARAEGCSRQQKHPPAVTMGFHVTTSGEVFLCVFVLIAHGLY
jgi:hypothetical protein